MSSITLSVTDFKARCLELFDRLKSGSLDRIEVTKRGKTVAIVTPPAMDEELARAVHGSMAAMTLVSEDVDLVAPALDEELEAAQGLDRS